MTLYELSISLPSGHKIVLLISRPFNHWLKNIMNNKRRKRKENKKVKKKEKIIYTCKRGGGTLHSTFYCVKCTMYIVVCTLHSQYIQKEEDKKEDQNILFALQF